MLLEQFKFLALRILKLHRDSRRAIRACPGHVTPTWPWVTRPILAASGLAAAAQVRPHFAVDSIKAVRLHVGYRPGPSVRGPGRLLCRSY